MSENILKRSISNFLLARSNDVSAYRKLLLDSVHLCFEVASAVFPVVGGDSPEGYVPNTVLHSNLPDVYKKKSSELAIYLKDKLSASTFSKRLNKFLFLLYFTVTFLCVAIIFYV